jgi:phosphatidylglycerophosphate synthase
MLMNEPPGSRNAPLARFGAANLVTTVRAGGVAFVALLIGQPIEPATAVWAIVVSSAVTALDGLDGWLARRTGQTSNFGARFDMEVDALLILVLAILAWRHDKAGAWVILSGLLRYLFIAGGAIWVWLERRLPPSRRRQATCVVQIATLIVVMLPSVTPPLSTALAAGGLAVLAFSFLIDVEWLWRHRSSIPIRAPGLQSRPRASLLAALFLLNASLTFGNVWPTPAIRWQGELSLELALLVLLILAAGRRARTISPALIGWLSALWIVLIVGHYGDVTAPALYGREINLYWDLRYIPDVVAMLVRVAPNWLVMLIAASALTIAYVVFRIVRWALMRLAVAAREQSERRMLEALLGIVFALFGLQKIAGVPPLPRFANLVVATYAHQIPLALTALTGSSSLPASPSMDSNLARVAGADLIVLFVESYGAITFDRPEYDERLTPSRAALDSAIHETGREVVSAFVESPTFGGGSWLAHLSLLSGVEVRGPDTYARLMTEKRETLVTTFARKGYRTIAVMPGLSERWPEGAFYKFDEIYGSQRLDYRGPPFGWWNLSDQFAIAKFDALEVNRPARQPLFVFFPTVSTHTPFTPTPPYQPDWNRILTDTPYEQKELDRAWDETPDWLNLGPGYVNAVAYAYTSIAGYLRLRADRDFVLILIGDHQPPAAVSGENARWDVPIHVIASRRAILESLRAHGFQTGLRPSGPSLTRMHALVPILLSALGSG